MDGLFILLVIRIRQNVSEALQRRLSHDRDVTFVVLGNKVKHSLELEWHEAKGLELGY